MTTITPILTQIKLLQKKRVVELTFDNGESFTLSCEYLRVNSPSAEARGHGFEKMPPITGKENVNIISIEPVGNYAVKFVFDDGHQTGLYSWPFLYQLAREYWKVRLLK